MPKKRELLIKFNFGIAVWLKSLIFYYERLAFEEGRITVVSLCVILVQIPWIASTVLPKKESIRFNCSTLSTLCSAEHWTTAVHWGNVERYILTSLLYFHFTKVNLILFRVISCNERTRWSASNDAHSIVFVSKSATFNVSLVSKKLALHWKKESKKILLFIIVDPASVKCK